MMITLNSKVQKMHRLFFGNWTRRAFTPYIMTAKNTQSKADITSKIIDNVTFCSNLCKPWLLDVTGDGLPPCPWVKLPRAYHSASSPQSFR
uniref:Uncharacterized protein n=1 Tax=Arundo donax TaxID=35708 RepID=A0A0A9GEM3_ARUDO